VTEANCEIRTESLDAAVLFSQRPWIYRQLRQAIAASGQQLFFFFQLETPRIQLDLTITGSCPITDTPSVRVGRLDLSQIWRIDQGASRSLKGALEVRESPQSANDANETHRHGVTGQ
jgi:hypothetical protein